MKTLTTIALLIIAISASSQDTTKQKYTNPQIAPGNLVPDSLRPKWIYYRKVDLPDPYLSRVFFVFDSLMGTYGVEMGGTQIKSAQKLYTDHRDFLFKHLPFDSTKIPEPQKPKK